MKILRSTLGWFLMGLAGFTLGVWAVAHYVTGKVESGHIATPIVDSILHQDDVQETITEQAQSGIAEALANEGVILTAEISAELDAAVASTVASEPFIDDLVKIVEDTEADVIAQLTDDSLPLLPLAISIDITEPLYAIIEAIPEFEGLVPTESLEPIELDEVLDVDAVDSVRNGYGWIETVSTWALWLGLALIALGVLAIPAKRWIIPKVLLGVGLSTLFLWLIVSRIAMTSLLEFLPDDAGPEVRDMISDLVPQSKVDGIQSTLWIISVILLTLAAAGFFLVWYIFRKRESAKQGDIPEGEVEAPTQGGIPTIFRKRWTLPKNLLKAGLTALVLWFIASRLNVESLLDRFFDESDIDARDAFNDFVSQSRVDGIQSFLWITSIILLVLAIAGFVLVWYLSRTTEAGPVESLPETGEEAPDPADAEGVSKVDDRLEGEETMPKDEAKTAGAAAKKRPGSTGSGKKNLRAKTTEKTEGKPEEKTE